MTGQELVREVAAKHGYRGLTDEVCNDILWEQTGFPHFFEGDPEEFFRGQLEEFFSRPGTVDEKRTAVLDERDAAMAEFRRQQKVEE
jgi:hypothetical protein